MAALRFTVILEPAEEGGFVSKCVELPVASQGETRDEALTQRKRLKVTWKSKRNNLSNEPEEKRS
jgi:predicted RNase H-like HicB family nuclease